MSDSSDEGCSEDWVFYRDREEWKDIEPVPQDDGPAPVVQIAYSDKYRDVYDYFRAILKKDEKSERALELTADAAALNSANYTVWHYRRLILQQLKSDLRAELNYISEKIEQHPKNYQVWHHRKMIVEWLKSDDTYDKTEELKFTAQILEQDAKNYHAWQHRQWVLGEFNLWNNELNYVNKLLEEDLRNNSAWNQRYYTIANTTKFTEDEVIPREIEYTKAFIRKAPNNESAWNYLRGVLLDTDLGRSESVMDFCEELYSHDIRSPYLLAFIIDICQDRLELKLGDHQDNLNKALKLCKKLAEEFDTIRREYWNYMARSLTTKYGDKESVPAS